MSDESLAGTHPLSPGKLAAFKQTTFWKVIWPIRMLIIACIAAIAGVLGLLIICVVVIVVVGLFLILLTFIGTIFGVIFGVASGIIWVCILIANQLALMI